MTRYSGDPHWITVRWRAVCHKCKAELKPGKRAFYYPNGRQMFCDGPAQCGPAAERDFVSLAQDEDTYNHVGY